MRWIDIDEFVRGLDADRADADARRYFLNRPARPGPWIETAVWNACIAPEPEPAAGDGGEALEGEVLSASGEVLKAPGDGRVFAAVDPARTGSSVVVVEQVAGVLHVRPVADVPGEDPGPAAGEREPGQMFIEPRPGLFFVGPSPAAVFVQSVP